VTEDVKWKSPPSNVVKLNWDAGLNVKEGRIGLGFIGRDTCGNCLVARSMSLEIQINAPTAEALATIYAINFCRELGHTNIIFEGDALQVIKAIESEGPYLTSYGHLIDCIQREL
jgi:ribonuclease HI